MLLRWKVARKIQIYPFNMSNANSNEYDDLDDDEKNEKYPEEFIEELQEEFQSGNIDEAITRAEDQGIGIEEIIS